ncbi:hypothetical protein [uncultured Erythrobacter sp.]|nr:hypothetical protein [uncultured Erythrobacter sp.]
MGHLLVSDPDEQFFYIDPDGMAVLPLGTKEEAQAHLDGEEANELWWGGELLKKGLERLGEPPEGSVINLKPMCLLEGNYSPENLWIVSLEELIHFTGSATEQIKDLPDGSQFELKIVD